MKKVALIQLTGILICFLFFNIEVFSRSNTDSITVQAKSYFYKAKDELQKMLEGKRELSYEQAIYIIENSYWENRINDDLYKYLLDYHTTNIIELIKSNYNEVSQNFKPTLLESEQQKTDKYIKALSNWAIYTYITDTTSFKGSKFRFKHLPYQYSTSDPLGTLDWSNTQVLNLLDEKYRQGNCFALASLFKIFSERLNSGANICTAPGHVYIRHADNKGILHNVELATRSFPGTGSLETLTYTTDEATINNISLRTLDLKQSVALCLVYLAKGYEYKFGIKADDFILQCAELTLQYDSLDLNAMLLKAEVLEQRLLNKNKPIAQLQSDKLFKQYEALISHLYKLGYREMPMEMKNIVISRLRNDTLPIIVQDHTPQPYAHLGVKEERYASLSWGLFEELHPTKPIEKYGQTVFDIKKKKITKFVTEDTTYNKYPIDMVVFAWNIDPLAYKFPFQSPYIFAGNSPIMFVDVDGAYQYPADKEASYRKAYPTLTKYLSNNVQEDVMFSQVLINGLISYSKGDNGKPMTQQQIFDAVSWGTGPTIEIVDMPGEGVIKFKNASGKYIKETNTIQINSQIANMLEKAEDKQAALYILSTVLMHETAHYGDYAADGEKSGDEVGSDLEKNIFTNQKLFDEGKEINLTGNYMYMQYDDNSNFKVQDNLKEANMAIENKKNNSDDKTVIPTVPK